MTDLRLLYPMAAMAVLTVLVGVVMLVRRIAATRSGQVSIGDFRLNVFAETAPAKMLQAARNYSNLFEMPVLFYAVCLAALATDLSGDRLVTLAWAFVAVRVVHSAVHVTVNNVTLRMLPFFASVILVAVMWFDLIGRARAVTGS